MLWLAFAIPFAKCELKTLQKLVDDKLLQTLISKIEKRKLVNHKLENTLIAVTSKKIVGLDLSDGVVFAKVKFYKKQKAIKWSRPSSAADIGFGLEAILHSNIKQKEGRFLPLEVEQGLISVDFNSCSISNGIISDML